MKLSKSVARSRARQRSKTAAEASVRRAKWDRWAAGIAIAIILALVAAFWFVVTIPSPLGWITQVLLLCLVVAAGAARALLGFGGRAQDAKLSARWSTVATGWPVVLAASVIVYVHSLSVGFLSDDFGLFYGARQATSARHALSTQALPSFFRPLSILLWWSGTKLWAGLPIGYHAANVVLHSVNSLLVYAVANRIIASRYGAAMAGLLFALHPLHVEPVVWLSCNADLLCTTFCLLSLLSLEVSLTATSRTRRILAAGGGLLAFWLALLSKEAALALPGVVVLRLALLGRERRWQRLLTLGSAYAAVLGGYLAWRFLVMGSFGGYQVRLNLWNTVFPSAPLRHLAGFFFPVNRALFGTVGGPWLFFAVALLMAVGLVWWLRSLTRVPASRLVLWLGFLFIMAVPVWALAATTFDLEHSRFSYLPTIGLAWLFGDICAGRGTGWRRSGAIAALTLFLAAALTTWYVAPWRQARRTTNQVVVAAADLLGSLEGQQSHVVVYVQGLPEVHRGAQVLRNCLPQAVSLRLGRRAPLRVVSQDGDIPPAVLAVSTLLSGEYLAAWQSESSKFSILRAGAQRTAPVLPASVR